MAKEWATVQMGVWRTKPKDKHRSRRRSRSTSPSPARHRSRKHASSKALLVPSEGVFLPPGKHSRASSHTGHSRRSRSSRRSSSRVRSPSTRPPSPSYRSDQSGHTLRPGNAWNDTKEREYGVPVPAGRSPGRSYDTGSQGYGHDSYPPPPGNYRAVPGDIPQVGYGLEKAPYQNQQRSYLPPPAPTPTPSFSSPSASMAAIPSAPTPAHCPAIPTPFPRPHDLAPTRSQHSNSLRPPSIGPPHRPQPSVPMGESIPQIRLPSPLPRTNPPSPISNTSRIQEIRTQTLEADLVNDQLSEILAEQKKLVREIVKLKEQNLRDVSEVEANAETRRLAEQKAELLQQRTSRSLLAPDPDSNRGISLPDRLESPPPMRRARSALPAARFGGDSSLSVTEQKVESRSRIGQKPDINKNSLMPDRLDSPPPMQRRRSCLPNNRFGGDSPLSAPEQNFHHPPQDRASRSRISLEPDNNKSDYLRDRLDSPPPMQRRRSGLPTAPFGGDSPPSEPEQKFQPFQDRASRSRIGALEPDSNRTNSLRDRLDSPPPMGRVRSGLPNIRFGGDGPLSGPEHKVNPLQDRARRSHLALEPDNYKGMPLRERLDSPPSMQRRPSGGLPTTRFGGESPPSGPKQKFQPFQDRVSRSRIGALEPDNDRGMSLPDRSESPPPMRRARSALPTARFGGNSLLPGSDNRHRSSFLGDNDEGYASHDDSGRWEGGNKRRSALLGEDEGFASLDDRRRAPSPLVTARRTGIDAEMGSSEDCDILSEVDRIRNKTAAAGATGTREAIRQLEQCLRDVKRNDADDPMDGLMRERSRRGI